jgi:hypothetical protein
MGGICKGGIGVIAGRVNAYRMHYGPLTLPKTQHVAALRCDFHESYDFHESLPIIKVIQIYRLAFMTKNRSPESVR